MNSAARPRNDTTKLRALATGLRLMTTAAPKISVSKAKIQNKNGDISSISNFELVPSFFLIPFQYNAVHDPTDLQQLLLVVHHIRSGEASDGVVLAEENGLLGANFFAHSAKNAADHVDIERLRIFLDFGEPIGRRDFARNNLNRARRTNKFAELACHATHAPVFIADKRGCAAIIVRQVAVPRLLRVLHRNFRASQQQVFEMLKRDGQASDDGRQIQSLTPVKLWSWNSDRHDYQ